MKWESLKGPPLPFPLSLNTRTYLLQAGQQPVERPPLPFSLSLFPTSVRITVHDEWNLFFFFFPPFPFFPFLRLCLLFAFDSPVVEQKFRLAATQRNAHTGRQPVTETTRIPLFSFFFPPSPGSPGWAGADKIS